MVDEKLKNLRAIQEATLRAESAISRGDKPKAMEWLLAIENVVSDMISSVDTSQNDIQRKFLEGLVAQSRERAITRMHATFDEFSHSIDHYAFRCERLALFNRDHPVK